MPARFFRLSAAILLLTGPWAYSQQAPKQPTDAAFSTQLRSYTKSPSAKKRIEASVGDFALWVDETKWTQDKVDTAGVLEFSNVNKGGLGVRIITEDNGVPLDRLREFVLANFKRASNKAKITLEEKRLVNGRQVLALQIAATVKGIPVAYFGYYYGGSSGTIQVIGFMIGAAISPDSIEDLTQFLNGLEISDEDLPPTGILFPGLLRFNSAITIKYDPEKWELQEDATDPGRFTIKSSSGDDDDGAGVVMMDRTVLPIDLLPRFVLANLQTVDAKAKVMSKNIRRVNGAKGWFLKIAFEGDDSGPGKPVGAKIRWIVFCYCYSGKVGTVQIQMVAKASSLPKHEKDLMEFLNGLLVSE